MNTTGAAVENQLRMGLIRKEAPPKERTEVYREVNHDQIEFTATGTLTDGSSISSKWTWPRQGGIAVRHLRAPLPEGLSYVETLIEPGDWYVTSMQNGKQIGVFRKIISKDGKTMSHIYKDIVDDQGIPIDAVLVFDRQ